MRLPRIGSLAAVTLLALTACGAGSLGSSDRGNQGTTLNFLADSTEASTKMAAALASRFHARNPNITVKVETRPQGADGDNVVKTRLATGEMSDVFQYNSGSLFQALNPAKNLAPVSDQPFVKNLDKTFLPSVSNGGKVYGAPWGGSIGGGILYNKKIYQRLGLQVPKTWDEFMANNAKIKAAGIAPVIQTYQDTWTSELLLLADYHNVASTDAQWADKYTRNQAKFGQAPAIEGFQHLQQVHQARFENKNYRSAKFEQGLRELATGKGAQYPMLTFAVGAIASANPQQLDDIGFFALPGSDAAKNGLTLWLPAGVYIAKTTTGA